VTGINEVKGSFRDPAGRMFRRDGVLYRGIAPQGLDDYSMLMSSGLYEELCAAGKLIPHEEAASPQAPTDELRFIRPREIPFISYPYEWCFEQMRAAALLTLDVQQAALARGMCLKDASAYNVQFVGPRCVFIDTLSFARRQANVPWAAYGQFCRHFLAPLALMSMRDARLAALLRTHLDGVPLDLAAKLLPKRSRLKMGLLSHLHMHAYFVKKFSSGGAAASSKNTRTLPRNALEALVQSLRSAVLSLKSDESSGEWTDYYDNTSYDAAAMDQKIRIVADYLSSKAPAVVWDIGANTGRFSQVACEAGAYTVAFDIDHQAVQRNYLDALRSGRGNLLPLVCDATNPSPPLGWALAERDSLTARGPADAVLALALVHHLAIANNIPLESICDFFGDICRSALIIEFVPKDDPQVVRMLSMRADIFDSYTPERFESVFSRRFAIERSQRVGDGPRSIYLMTKR